MTFSLNNNVVQRWKQKDKIIYYSGLQMIALDIFNHFSLKKFSCNEVWDFQIKNKALYGNLMKSKLYHIGDLKGLNQLINSIT